MIDILPLIFGVIGAIGAIAFAGVNLPQVIKCHKTKRTDMLSMLTIKLNLVGNVFSCAYVLYKDIVTGDWHYPLYVNYCTALVVAIFLYCLKRKHG